MLWMPYQFPKCTWPSHADSPHPSPSNTEQQTNEKNRYYSPSMLTSRLVIMFVRNHHAEKCCVHRSMWQEREHVTFSVYSNNLNRYGYVGTNFSCVFWSSSIELWTEQSLPGPQDMQQKSMENHWMISTVASSLFLLTKALDGFVYLEHILGEYLPWLYSDMTYTYIYIRMFYSYKCCEYWKTMYVEHCMVGGFCGCQRSKAKPECG